LDVVEGIAVDRVIVSLLHETIRKTRTVELDSSYILLVDKKNLKHFAEMCQLLKPVAKSSKPLLIIAEGC